MMKERREIPQHLRSTVLVQARQQSDGGACGTTFISMKHERIKTVAMEANILKIRQKSSH
jgi:hypothetical protein